MGKGGWEVQQIIPWEIKEYKEYMILFKRKKSGFKVSPLDENITSIHLLEIIRINAI